MSDVTIQVTDRVLTQISCVDLVFLQLRNMLLPWIPPMISEDSGRYKQTYGRYRRLGLVVKVQVRLLAERRRVPGARLQ